MAVAPIYYDQVPPAPFPELADHPHERLHQHNTFLGSITRRKPDQKTYPNHPDCDVSDNLSHYLVDLELPGVKDPKSVSVNWISWRSVVVSGTITRPGSRPDDQDSSKGANGNAGVAKDELALHRDDSKKIFQSKDEQEDADDLPPWLILGERRIGAFRREFHFPVDVDMEKLEAKLEGGLLRLKVPKKQHSFPKGSGKVNIASGD
nr:hypothetical protein B0A51_08025 [Rachicladosporium sp. CCFEE 5018]